MQAHGCCFNKNMSRKITAIKVQKRNPQRVNIYLDGEFAFGLARIVAAWLQVGQELSEEKIAALQEEDRNEVAYQRALKFLSYRPRSEAEIRANLKKHDVSKIRIEAVLARLREIGLVDDHEFARLWVENRSEFRPRGRYALRMELRQKGVQEEIIEETLAAVDEDALAYKAAQKKARRLRTRDFDEFRKKMYGFLSRRGFTYEITSSVIQRIWEDTHHQIDYQEE